VIITKLKVSNKQPIFFVFFTVSLTTSYEELTVEWIFIGLV